MNSYLNNQQAPRGIRNNNPANIILSSITWFGKVTSDDNTDGHFEQFDCIEHGIRAAFKDVHTLVSNGANTPFLLASEYAPRGDGSNDPTAYARNIAAQCGIATTDTIDPSDDAQMSDVLTAIFAQENGSTWSSYITPDIFNTGKQLSNLFFS